MQEVEIKFRIDDLARLRRALHVASFQMVTPRTREVNTLYDLPGQPLRKRGELLRVRRYGKVWTVTFKAKALVGRHKSRREIETTVKDGAVLETILQATGFRPGFRYEKFRTEFADRSGHVVIDETPIGVFGEIEGPPRWIDSIARRLHIQPSEYITDSYAGLFVKWKLRTRSRAGNMLFAEIENSR